MTSNFGESPRTDRKGNQSLRFSKIITLRSKVLCREAVFRFAGPRENRCAPGERTYGLSPPEPPLFLLAAGNGVRPRLAAPSAGAKGGPVRCDMSRTMRRRGPERFSVGENGNGTMHFRGGRAYRFEHLCFATIRLLVPARRLRKVNGRTPHPKPRFVRRSGGKRRSPNAGTIPVRWPALFSVRHVVRCACCGLPLVPPGTEKRKPLSVRVASIYAQHPRRNPARVLRRGGTTRRFRIICG